MTHKNFAIFAVILSMIIWGANATVMKYTLLSVPPFSLGFIRFFGASILFLPFLYKKIKMRDITPLILLTGFIGITLTLSLFFIGLKLTTALNAGIIAALSPLLILVGAHFILREKIKKSVLFGAGFGLLGVSIIIGKDILNHGFTLSPLGDFLIFVSVFGTVFYSIFCKKILEKLSPIIAVFYLLLIGGVGFLPGTIWEWQINPNWTANLSNTAILGILYGIVFSSFFAHLFWQWGLSKMDVTKVGFFHYLEPIATTITAILILSEKITLPFIIGSTFIFLGLMVAEVHRHHHPPHHR